MFYINKDTVLDQKLLSKMISRFFLMVEPKLIEYKNYYDGAQAILNKAYSDTSKPCNKTVINYCKNIVDSYCGYIATPGHISYSSADDIEEIMDILRYNDYQAQDASLLLDALIYGTAAELMYIDSDSKTRFRLINPTQCFGVYDDSLSSDLLYFVRIYKVDEWDDNEKYNVDVYSDTDIKHYSMLGRGGALTYVSEEPHYFGQCPANIFMLSDEKSIFDCIMSLQDTSNELLSAEVDDYSAFCDAYLVIEDADLDADTVKEMKENRVLQLPQGAKAYWLTKAANDAQVENILKRIHDSIYRISACVDFSSESFTGGVSSGIAIQFKLSGMEQRAGKVEAEMKKALQRRVEILCGVATLKLGEAVFRDIEITFKRNVPADTASVVQLLNSLRGLVSDETLLSQVDFISDVQAELNRLSAQRERDVSLYGNTLFDDAESESESANLEENADK